jgi:hypothetical protein
MEEVWAEVVVIAVPRTRCGGGVTLGVFGSDTKSKSIVSVVSSMAGSSFI